MAIEMLWPKVRFLTARVITRKAFGTRRIRSHEVSLSFNVSSRTNNFYDGQSYPKQRLSAP